MPWFRKVSLWFDNWTDKWLDNVYGERALWSVIVVCSVLILLLLFRKRKHERGEGRDRRESVVGRLSKGLAKSRDKFSNSLRSLVGLDKKLDPDKLQELAEILITADVGPRAAERIADDVRKAYDEGCFGSAGDLLEFLKEDMKKSLRAWDTSMHMAESGPTVILIAGVNGTGKTTSTGKLAAFYKGQGKRVLVAAGDTYRAAAVEQLEIWTQRAGVDIVKHQRGADPGAVVHDAAQAALARNMDLLLVDTAGRLHTRDNLMRELSKIRRVIEKIIPGAPQEVLLVLDATTGQNVVSQAKLFHEVIDVTGLLLAKLDGTAKGGIVIGMRDQVDIPVKFVGLGEKLEDIEPFDPDAFVDALFE